MCLASQTDPKRIYLRSWRGSVSQCRQHTWSNHIDSSSICLVGEEFTAQWQHLYFVSRFSLGISLKGPHVAEPGEEPQILRTSLSVRADRFGSDSTASSIQSGSRTSQRMLEHNSKVVQSSTTPANSARFWIFLLSRSAWALPKPLMWCLPSALFIWALILWHRWRRKQRQGVHDASSSSSPV